MDGETWSELGRRRGSVNASAKLSFACLFHVERSLDDTTQGAFGI